LSFADGLAAAARLPEIRLFTNVRMTKSIRLYKNRGFREVGIRAHPTRKCERFVDLVRDIAADGHIRSESP
jgi:ribosomal protein S18 acetylase RimI-like enzyme